MVIRENEDEDLGGRGTSSYLEDLACKQASNNCEQLGDTDDEAGEVGTSVELSLNLVVGLTATETMKLKGMIKTNEVIVLIDCRASHNFISDEVVW